MAKSAVALGFRVKSGFAIAVVLRGPAAAPTVVARRIVELSDPDVAETRQPYHRGFYTHEKDQRTITRRLQIVERCAKQSVTALLADEARRRSLGAAARVVARRNYSWDELALRLLAIYERVSGQSLEGQRAVAS